MKFVFVYLGTIVLVSGLVYGADYTCILFDGCRCNGDGFSIDISEVIKYPIYTHQSDAYIQFAFTCFSSMCGNFHGGSAVCGWDISQQAFINCGMPCEVEWNVTNEKNFSVTYKNGDKTKDNRDRESRINFVIDSEKDTILRFVNENDSNKSKITYVFELTISAPSQITIGTAITLNTPSSPDQNKEDELLYIVIAISSATAILVFILTLTTIGIIAFLCCSKDRQPRSNKDLFSELL